ncbi:glycosyltransferase [Zobellia laminariae]|uniref:glycosyltransferase n=1 Tax=Zobellia laminariae TaxID=248906 RepID=UPI0026F41168|nr:glycosyltransferase [Zobellia laminariae]WKX76464.1 glycosyltransferase [Zobellia laminariae]
MKKTILFILPSLGTGGAEKVLCFLAQNLNKNLFSCSILITGKKTNNSFSTGETCVTFLGKNRVLSSVPDIFLFLIKQRPDIVFSSIGHLNTVMGLLSPLFIKTKFIIREASVVSVMQKFAVKNVSGTNFLSKWAFNNVDKVVCQSTDMANDFKALYNINDSKIVVIGNPITSEVASVNNKKCEIPNKFITIGRLSKEKGHNRILKVLARLERDFSYLIIGDGPERKNLIKQINTLGLSDKITHITYTDNVDKYLCEYDLFLQGSYVEGFPNAALESCAVGTPVLAFTAWRNQRNN